MMDRDHGAAPQILRAADRKAQPWKNGGGVTREVAAFPPGADLDSIGWRVSLAEVAAEGPFSAFAGIDRQLAVLEGRLELAVDGLDDAVTLTPDSPPFAFPGDLPAYGTPLGGMVRDLNLMVRRGRFRGEMARLAPGSAHKLTGGTSLLIALAPTDIVLGDETLKLDPLDAVLFADGAGDPVSAMRAGICYRVTVDPVA